MPITPRQRQLRSRTIGSSDSAAIMGLSPWRTAADVYWEKVEPAPESESANQRRGNALEPFVLDFAQRDLGKKVYRNRRRVLHRGPGAGIIAANLDGIALDGTVVEAKTSTDLSRREEWGEEDTDEVPTEYLIQVQHQMLVTGAPVAYLYALLSWNENLQPVRYRIGASAEIQDAIRSAAVSFWQDNVLPRIPPVGAEVPPLEVVKRRQREEGKLAEGLDPIVAQRVLRWERMGEFLKAVEEMRDRELAAIADAMGDGDRMALEDGRLFKYAEQQGRRMLDTERLWQDHGEILARYEYRARPTRVARITGKAKGKEIEAEKQKELSGE